MGLAVTSRNFPLGTILASFVVKDIRSSIVFGTIWELGDGSGKVAQ